MAARDKHWFNAKCPRCGQAGRVLVSEENHPYMRSPDTRVVDVEGDFTAQVTNEVNVTVTCTQCGGVFNL